MEIRDRLCAFSARELNDDDTLRVATATDAAQILSQMDAVLRSREQGSIEKDGQDATESTPSAEDIFSHMSAYMEAATP
jgi:hypothetical protein